MATFIFISLLASAAFVVVASRWLMALRAAALDRRLPLTWLDKFLVAAPIPYSVAVLLLAGLLFDRLDAVVTSTAATQRLPLLGEVDTLAAGFLLLMLAAVGLASPLGMVRITEVHFARKMPEVRQLARRALFATLTGVRMEHVSEAVAPAPPLDDEEEWRRLLRRSRRG